MGFLLPPRSPPVTSRCGSCCSRVLLTCALLTTSSHSEGQWSPERYAFLFMPGHYAADVPVGFYTTVAGLGRSPDDVVFTGAPTNLPCYIHALFLQSLDFYPTTFETLAPPARLHVCTSVRTSVLRHATTTPSHRLKATASLVL